MQKNQFWKLFLTFLKIGCFTFGGGYAMISIIERDLVEEKQWLTQEELTDILVVAESTPGPIIINTATYVGYKINGVLGGILASIGAILPSLIIITLLYSIMDIFQENRWVEAAFRGVHCAVVVLLTQAVLKIIMPMPKTAITISIGVLSLLVALFTDFNSIYLILAGGVFGVLWFVLRKGEKK